MAEVVVDASALVDLLLENVRGDGVRRRIERERLHAPAHLDGEVLSALGRLHRAGRLTADEAAARLRMLRAAPITRHLLPDLVSGAWARRERVRLVDAVYLELADHLDARLVTTDRGLRGEPNVDLVEG